MGKGRHDDSSSSNKNINKETEKRLKEVMDEDLQHLKEAIILHVQTTQ